MKTAADVIVIGGGIVGLSTAYHLAKLGAKKVVVLERDLVGSGSTGRCAGGIRQQFSTPTSVKISIESVKIYRQFKEEFGADPDFRENGYLFVARSEKELAQFRANVATQRALGVPVDLLPPDDLRKIVPGLNLDGVVGGTFCPTDGYAGPNEVVQGITRATRRLGVRVLEGAEVIEVEATDSRATGVKIKGGEFAAPVIVCAAGVGSRTVGKMVGLDIPVRPYRRSLFVTQPLPALGPRLPMLYDLTHGFYMRGEQGGALLCGGRDLGSSFNTELDWASLDWAAEQATRLIPAIAEAEVNGGWAGSIDATPDLNAIMGPARGLEGFYVATGFSGHGFMHGPAAGLLMAELVLHGKATTVDISEFALERFAEGHLIKEEMHAPFGDEEG